MNHTDEKKMRILRILLSKTPLLTSLFFIEMNLKNPQTYIHTCSWILYTGPKNLDYGASAFGHTKTLQIVKNSPYLKIDNFGLIMSPF